MEEFRNVIHSLDARVVQVSHLEADQHALVIDAPAIAESATPGSFVHLGVHAEPSMMRRPLSILWSDPERGTIEVLYKIVGKGRRSWRVFRKARYCRRSVRSGEGSRPNRIGIVPC